MPLSFPRAPGILFLGVALFPSLLPQMGKGVVRPDSPGVTTTRGAGLPLPVADARGVMTILVTMTTMTTIMDRIGNVGDLRVVRGVLRIDPSQPVVLVTG